MENLEEIFKQGFENVPEIEAWNRPRSGHNKHVFVSRYGGPPPDDDFIDLDALAWNAAHSLTLQSVYDRD